MAELTWLGHACFRLRGRDVTVLLDPVGRHLGYDISRVRPDIVTVSHDHPGHNNLAALKGSYTLLDGPGEYEIRDVFVTGVRTYHDDQKGARFGYNTVYVVQIDDIIFCHLGDLGHALASDQVDQIGSVDVLLVPAGGGSLAPTVAAEVISQLEPGLIVPMHYATGSVPAPDGLEPLERFGREFGLQEATPRERLSLRKADIPEETQFVVLSDRGA